MGCVNIVIYIILIKRFWYYKIKIEKYFWYKAGIYENQN